MTLVDSSIWIDHLSSPNVLLQELLQSKRVLMHPFVIGELAMGSLRDRQRILRTLQKFPAAVIAHDEEVLSFVSSESLFSQGIGYIDAHLLASTRLTPGSSLWTRDRRLRSSAISLGLAFDPA